jgi:hypothetical protein
MTPIRLALSAFAACAGLLLLLGLALGQTHPQSDMELHDRFYKTWMMPDQPTASCCNDQDCYPVEAQFRDGAWYARQRETGQFVRVPDAKIERNRDNPDGRSHVCMSPTGTVFCFSLGGGT